MNSPAIESVVHKYEVLDTKQQMTLDEAKLLSIELARRIAASDARPECVVGIANGALFTARIVADQLSLPLRIVLVRRRGSQWKRRLSKVVRRLHIPMALVAWEPLMPFWRLYQRRTSQLQVATDNSDVDVAGKRVVLVDDCVETGNSIRMARDRLLDEGAAGVTLAALCWYRGIGDSGEWKPDIHLHTFTHFYPWSESSLHHGEFMSWLASRSLQLRS